MKIPDKGRKPVINCLFEADSTFIVQVFQSHFILDQAQPQPVENALVTITENESVTDTLVYSSQRYYTGLHLLPQIGKTYKIEAIVNGQSATGTETIPSLQTITKIDTLTHCTQDGDFFGFNVQIKDPAQETNYYLLKIEKTVSCYSGYSTITISANSDDLSLDDQWQGSYIINDNIFNGKTKVFPLDIALSNLYNYNDSINTFYISLYSISKDYYLYAKTVQAQNYSGNSPFSEPIMVYNNIKNGYGIFAGASVYRYSIKVPSIGSGYPMK